MGSSAEDMRARLRQRQQAPASQRDRLRRRLEKPDDPTATASALTLGFTRFMNNILGIPGSVESGAEGLSEADQRLGLTGEGRFQAPPGGFADMPQAQDIVAGTRAAPAMAPGGEAPSEAFRREREDISAELEGMREVHPVASRAGEIGADVLTIFAGRKPVAGLMRRAERRLARKPALPATGLSRDIQRVVTSAPMRRLARGAGRSIETGLEAAVLESVKGDDPLETAAMAAGGQALGSAFVYAASRPKWVGAAILAGGALQMLKSVTPGGQNRILESIESGFDKVSYGVALGALSAVAGAPRYGRAGANISEQTAAVLDGIATAHRGTVLSILTDWTEGDEDERAEIEQALENAANPDYKGRTEKQQEIMDRLRASVPSRGSVSGTIDRGGTDDTR